MTAENISNTPLEAYWMPYTGNRQFKRDPRILVAANNVWFKDDMGRTILDGHSGLEVQLNDFSRDWSQGG